MRKITFDDECEKQQDFMTENSEAFASAFMYLSMWGLGSYTEVNLIWLRDDEILAQYSMPNGSTYTIGAIWHSDEKRFSFHS